MKSEAQAIAVYDQIREKLAGIGLEVHSNSESIAVRTSGGIILACVYSVDALQGWAAAVTEFPNGLLAEREKYITDKMRGYGPNADKGIGLHREFNKKL